MLCVVWAAVCLPNLGAPPLWDIDEGNNAGCAYEMARSGNFVVPTLNYALRPDKPALLYWLQAAAFELFFMDKVPARVALSEYVDVTDAFFDGGDEPRFVNGVLNTLARNRRPAEFTK